jgi:hypothetical protein
VGYGRGARHDENAPRAAHLHLFSSRTVRFAGHVRTQHARDRRRRAERTDRAQNVADAPTETRFCRCERSFGAHDARLDVSVRLVSMPQSSLKELHVLITHRYCSRDFAGRRSLGPSQSRDNDSGWPFVRPGSGPCRRREWDRMRKWPNQCACHHGHFGRCISCFPVTA